MNEQPGLTSMHTLWVREHNRIVDELVELHQYGQDNNDEKEILFQEARRIVIAEYQVGFKKSLCWYCVYICT